MRHTLLSGVAFLIVLLVACSSGSKSDRADPTVTTGDLQQYFDQLEQAYAENVTIENIDPADPDYAELARLAVAALQDIDPPDSVADLHGRLIEAGSDYADSLDSLAAIASGMDAAEDATPSAEVLRALLGVRNAEAQIEGVCLDLLDLANEYGIDRSPCGSNNGDLSETEPCADFVSAHPVRPAETYAEAVAEAEELYGAPLPFPADAPPGYARFKDGPVTVGVSEERTPPAGPTPTGSGIALEPTAATLPEVRIYFTDLPECDPLNAYSTVSVVDGSGRTVTATLSSSKLYTSSSDSPDTTQELETLSASLEVGRWIGTIELRWDESKAPPLAERVSIIRDWIERLVLAPPESH